MTATLFPSGDPAADRRAAFAETLAHLGDMPAAIEVLDGALAIVPGWAAGWFMLGNYFELVGETEAASNAWDKAVCADPADPLGAGLKRDLARKVPLVESMPPAFVETLFDQYAPRFERSLVEKLDYRGPALLLQSLRAAGFERAEHALDLGCGTGLMGEQLRPLCNVLEGNDLSRAMLAEAAAKSLYDALEKTDIARLDARPETYDLIVAADVLIYIGALESVIGWCAQALRPDGWLAFTVEEGDAPFSLGESRRFTHSRGYLTDLLTQARFTGVRLTPCVLRQDRGAPVSSLCVTARAPGLPQTLETDGSDAVPA